MRYSLLSAALFAACTVAAPIEPRKFVYDVTVVTVTDVVTVVGPSPTPAPNDGNQFIQQPQDTPAPVPTSTYEPPAPSSAAPVPSTAPSTSNNDGSPMSGGKSILSIVNKYRGKYNLNLLEWSDHLQGNAQKTTDDNHGSTQNHELNPGSYGQCLTPGFSSATSGMKTDGLTPFEMAYLSWMCESSGDSQLSAAENGGVDLCSLITGPSSIMHMDLTELGHYKILTSTSYKTIGCAFTSNPSSTQDQWTGLWGCDLGF